jgi:DNA repair exonuclease SbcCD nuclease subunit
MKIVLFSDLHIHAWSEFAAPHPSGMSSRLHACVSVIDDIRAHCLAQGIRHVIFGGDLFHKRGVIHTHAYNEAVAAFERLRASQIDVWAVNGNHDHADKLGTMHALQALATTHTINGIGSRGWEIWHLGNVQVSAFAYCDDRALLMRRLQESLAVKPATKPARRIGIFHHGFKGAAVGPALEYVVKEDLDITEIIPHFDFVFSGHYHAAQLIGGLPNARYIGSPLEHIRGEHAVHGKGFLEFDTIKLAVKLVKLKRPRFVKLDQKQIKARAFDHVAGNYVDVVYRKLPCSEAAFASRYLKQALGVKFIPKQGGRAQPDQRLDIDLSMDTKTLLQKYITYKEGDANLLALGLDLFNQAGEAQ